MLIIDATTLLSIDQTLAGFQTQLVEGLEAGKTPKVSEIESTMDLIATIVDATQHPAQLWEIPALIQAYRDVRAAGLSEESYQYTIQAQIMYLNEVVENMAHVVLTAIGGDDPRFKIEIVSED